MGVIQKTMAVASVLAATYLLGSTGACNYLTRKSGAPENVSRPVIEMNKQYCALVDVFADSIYSKVIQDGSI